MWFKIARLILRNRLLIIAFLILATAFMGFMGRQVKLQYGLPKLLPDQNETLTNQQLFRENFGPESVVFAFGINRDPLQDITLFNNWYQLVKELQNIHGVDTIVSVTNLYNLKKNTELKKFELTPIVAGPASSKEELDSLRQIIQALPFYEGYLFNTKTDASIMGISINRSVFNSTGRMQMVDEILRIAKIFEEENNIQIHYSGLPIIRTVMTEMTKAELKKFVLLALLVTIIILFLFFRSLKPVIAAMIVVFFGVIWSLGTLAIFDYEITILTSIIPPLLIVIGIPNCIFLINKYHAEYRRYQNQGRALSRVIEKIGKATFLTNATTAVGFFTFIFTQSTVLIEFGIVAGINILLLFLFSILIIPIYFSFLPSPEEKYMKHLDYRWMSRALTLFLHWSLYKRKFVYASLIVVIALSAIGISKMKVTGNIAGDMPKGHFIVEDLKFFENNFNGIIPFEVSIDAKKPKAAVKSTTLKKIEQLQDSMKNYTHISKPISIVEGIKFTKQAYYGGREDKYELINSREKVFFKPYIENVQGDRAFLKTFLDSSERYTRINVQVADLGTQEMDALKGRLEKDINAIFDKENYNVFITGASVVFLEGTKYLVKNLFISLIIAIFLVGLIMAALFRSFKMIIISITANLVPLLITAAIMGFFGIPLKPSTILVFSIAFGISVDDTIHFLAKFRQEAKLNNWNIKDATVKALEETGVSMTYTSIVLFFGFAVFASSQFGGTQALGILVSITLFTAIFSNLILLPAFLMTINDRINKKIFGDPLIDIYQEEEDIELSDLKLNNLKNNEK